MSYLCKAKKVSNSTNLYFPIDCGVRLIYLSQRISPVHGKYYRPGDRIAGDMIDES